jgi:pimeloyl-ACP methyl ester carboxylesterase
MEERKIGGIGYLAARWPLDSNKFTLVFIHGAGGTGSFWQPQIDALADKANTLALDLPGHGSSDGPGKDKIEDYAQVVNEFVNELKIPNPLPCGVSMGGAIAQHLLMDFAQCYPAGILMGTGARMGVAPAIFETIESDFSAFVDMIGTFAVSQKTDPGLVQPFKEEFARGIPEIVLGDFRACDRFDSRSGLSSIKVPVLIITSEDDQLTPAKYGEFLEKNIQKAQRVHLMDAGHIVSVERPDEVNTLILEFLDTLGS